MYDIKMFTRGLNYTTKPASSLCAVLRTKRSCNSFNLHQRSCTDCTTEYFRNLFQRRSRF